MAICCPLLGCWPVPRGLLHTLLQEAALEEQEQAVPNTAEPSRLSARKGSHVVSGAAEGQQEQGAGGSSPEPLAGGRYSLRRSSMRMPGPAPAVAEEGEGEAEASTPTAAGLGLQAPVPQDGSPAFAESLGMAAAASAAAAPAGQPRSARKPGGNSTPAAARTPSAAGPASAAETPGAHMTTRRRASMAAAAAAAATPQAVSLSPTEQGIRSALRRSARKSVGKAGPGREG